MAFELVLALSAKSEKKLSSEKSTFSILGLVSVCDLALPPLGR
jgi:hypothetical protein